MMNEETVSKQSAYYLAGARSDALDALVCDVRNDDEASIKHKLTAMEKYGMYQAYEAVRK